MKLISAKDGDKLIQFVGDSPEVGISFQDLANLAFDANNGMTLPFLWVYMLDTKIDKGKSLAEIIEPVAAQIKRRTAATDDEWRKYLTKRYETYSPLKRIKLERASMYDIFGAKDFIEVDRPKYNLGDNKFRIGIMRALHATKSDLSDKDKKELEDYINNNNKEFHLD